MSRTSRIGAAFASVFLLLLFGVACQTGPKVETVVEKRPDGVVVVQTVRLQASVVAIDATKRTVRLKPKRGEEKTLKVGEGAVNFEQVRVGDEVHAVLIEETAISLVPGGAPSNVAAGAAVALAPVGQRPGAVMAGTVETTATIVAIDGHEHTLTLQFLDGEIRELDVAKDRDLSQVGLGDSVRIQYTEAIAIEVVKPSP
ncbi:MAG: hypothetical protein JRH01_19195 [Deltaproteobacteria bacterium]|nr:hypothetical protein [Deltaproteobacteria bacterium]MBW2396377.1 hypothetical protein [Deltaproteobacteria bacterium]